MLIWIDASVQSADLALDVEACHGVSAIFAAAFRGEHFVLGTRETLGVLAANSHLASVTRTTISTIQANLAISGVIRSRLATHVVVTYGKAAKCRRIGDSSWEIPLKEIGVRGTRKSLLLTENMEDARAYEHAAKQYQASVRITGQIALEKASGGGSTTPEAFDNHARTEKRWCLCITDSDRLSPADNMDVTAQKCNGIARDESLLAIHIDLTAREIENIVPLAFLAEAIPPSHIEKWEWHVNKVCKVRAEAHRYCDIKLGTTLRNIMEYTHDSPRRKYWESLIAELTKASALISECNDYTECMAANVNGVALPQKPGVEEPCGWQASASRM